MADINATLAERGSRYGEFSSHATITQAMKDVMHETDGWKRLNPPMREALEMVVHKIGRILNGDPSYTDSWHDIAGYARLVEDHLTGVDSNKAPIFQPPVNLPNVPTKVAEAPVVKAPVPAPVQAPAVPAPVAHPVAAEVDSPAPAVPKPAAFKAPELPKV